MLQHFIKTLKRHSYLITAILLIAIGFNIGGFAHLSLADTPCPSNLSSLSGLGLPAYCNVVGSDSSGLLTHIINLLLALLGVVAVLFIIIGGYKMVVSNGDEKAFESGRKTVTYAIIGLVVAVLAFTIITVIGNTIGSGSSNPGSSTTTNSNTSTPNATGNNSTTNPTTGNSGTTTGSSTSTNSSTSTGTNGSVGNSTVSQAAPISASSSSCTAAAMGGINISAPSSAVVDPSNGGSIEYAITPDNSSANGCQVTIDTYILEGSDTWNSNLDPNDSSIGFGKANTLTIPESYSQDPYVTIYSMYTDSTGASVNTSANLNLSESSSAGSANNCSAAGVGGINLSVPSSVTVDPSSGGSLEYTLTPDNSSAASCQITINTYVLANGAGAPASGQQPDDTATGFGTNTVNIPAADAYGSEVTLYSVYTDSTGASVNTSESVSITQPSNDNSSDSSNDGSDNSGSYDSGD